MTDTVVVETSTGDGERIVTFRIPDSLIASLPRVDELSIAHVVSQACYEHVTTLMIRKVQQEMEEMNYKTTDILRAIVIGEE